MSSPPAAAPTLLGQGWGSVAYAVGDRVVRLARTGLPEPLTGDLRREVALVPWLAARGLPVARDLRPIEIAGAFLGTVHRRVPGRPARGTARLAAEVAAFLDRLHAFAAAPGVPEVDLWADRYAGMIAASLPLLGPATAAWLEERARRFVDEGATARAPRVLVHGDLGRAHLLVHRGRLGVIDFGDAMIADPALDLAALAHDFGWTFAERVAAARASPSDPDLRRRARFYADVAPLYSIRYGWMFGERDRGRRRLAARARGSR